MLSPVLVPPVTGSLVGRAQDLNRGDDTLRFVKRDNLNEALASLGDPCDEPFGQRGIERLVTANDQHSVDAAPVGGVFEVRVHAGKRAGHGPIVPSGYSISML